MKATDRTSGDALLDLLAEAVARRLGNAGSRAQHGRAVAARRRPITRAQRPNRRDSDGAAGQAGQGSDALVLDASGRAAEQPGTALEEETPPRREPLEERAASQAAKRGPEPSAIAPNHAAALMARLACGVLFIVVLINVPFNTHGAALARSIPSSASLVIHDGLVVKEATNPRIWVYRDGAFHWITSLDAFTYFGYRWQDVHIVPAGFLNGSPKGKSLYVLLKCDASPNIYQLDGGTKHWIVDIPTFTAQGYVWADVKFVSCASLRALPDGDSIPPGRGAPPSPLP